MAEINKFRVGLFVIGGIVLFVVCVCLLGMRGKFVKKANLVTFVNETLQGVNVGAAVKYKGVSVGNVTNMSIMMEDKMIRVDMVVELNAFSSKNDRNIRSVDNFYLFLAKEVKSGLRCSIEFSGITGLRYIDLNYPEYKDQDLPITENQRGAFYIPAVRSKFSDILKLLTISLDKISKVDYTGISKSVMDTLESTRSILLDPKLRASIDKLENMSTNLEKMSQGVSETITAQRLKESIDNFNTTVKSIHELTQTAQQAIEKSKFSDTTSAIRKATLSVNEMEEAVKISLRKLNEAIDNLKELANTLEENPDVLLRGKSKQPQLVQPK